MDIGGLRLVLHPAHLKHSSSQAPLPLLLPAFDVATESVVKRLEALQHLADEEANRAHNILEPNYTQYKHSSTFFSTSAFVNKTKIGNTIVCFRFQSVQIVWLIIS